MLIAGGLADRLLVIRADADSRMGTGHVMRCLALAQAWQEQGGRAVMAGLIGSGDLRERLKRSEIALVELETATPAVDDMSWLTELRRREKPGTGQEWLVLDGYHFDYSYQHRLRSSGMKILVVDDAARLPQYDADILLNQNAGSEKISYGVPEETMLLTGSRYTLLRREFREAQYETAAAATGVAGRILITLGGADPDNVTAKVVKALRQMITPAMQAKIIVGPANPHLALLQKGVENLLGHAEVLVNVNNMAPLMQWADVAITAGGGTCWELACLGVPALIITLADNQRIVAEMMASAGAGLDCGWHHELRPATLAAMVKDLCRDQCRRSAMSKAGRSLVDGQGALRVVECMRYFPFTFRPAEQADCLLVFEWANDSVVRRASFHGEQIGRREHEEWFAKTLADSGTIYWIIMLHGRRPCGQVRFAVHGAEAEISISLAVGYRNVGLGSKAIGMACRRLFAMGGISRVIALVKKDNEQSMKSFARAGFAALTEEVLCGAPSLKMCLESKWQ